MRAKLIELTAVRPICVGEFRVGEQRLHDALRVVEAAFQRDVVDIGVGAGGHLPPLHVADPALRMHHEDIDIGKPAQRGDRGRAGVARLVAATMVARPPRLRQRAANKLAQHLQRDVLEGQGGAVKQLQQIAVAGRSRPAARSRARRNRHRRLDVRSQFGVAEGVAGEARQDLEAPRPDSARP